MNEQHEKMSRLARDVLKLDRNTLLVNLRFMDMALSQFEFIENDMTELATDGHYLVYNPIHVLTVFKGEKEASVRDYLHVVFHCVFQHMFIHSLIEEKLWNLACDIAVEKTISELGIRSANAHRQSLQGSVITKLQKELNLVTAEKIYHYYQENNLSDSEIERLAHLFYADDHMLWYMTEDQKNKMLGTGGNSQNDGNGNDESESSDSESGVASVNLSSLEMESTWKDIAEHMQMDLETFSKERGDQAGGLVQNLREVNREKYNYESFLRRFAVRGEVMKLDMDEFDYIFYTYGLQLYGNVPLIEPLEYKEVNRIKEFVVAIDTSGSTSGELVQRFIQKTYNILKSTESFFSKINLHIIQCDADIQEDAKITNQEEFDLYLKNMQIHGLGGTDFRPVFRYVNELIEQKDFQNLKGLIYFTDGWGVFPEYIPDYETAFVFIDDGWNNYDVPPWAMKLILQENEI